MPGGRATAHSIWICMLMCTCCRRCMIRAGLNAVVIASLASFFACSCKHCGQHHHSATILSCPSSPASSGRTSSCHPTCFHSLSSSCTDGMTLPEQLVAVLHHCVSSFSTGKALLLCYLLHFLRVDLRWYQALCRAVNARLQLFHCILHVVPASSRGPVRHLTKKSQVCK